MEPPSPYRISVINASGRRPRLALVRRTLQGTLARLGFPPGELSVRLSDDAEVRQANHQFRGRDVTTDVLTFPPPDAAWPEGSIRPLGDLLISVPQAERQAAVRGYSVEAELAYLGLHGVLHLAGYDDETPADRKEMLDTMSEFGVDLGLPALGDWHTLEPMGAAG